MLLQSSIPSVSGIYHAILGLGITVIIVIIVVMIILSTLFLMLGLKAVNGEKRGFGAVFLTTILNLLVSVIPILGCILEWVIINARHKTGFGKAILAWLIAIVIPYIIIGIIIFATGIGSSLLSGLGLGSGLGGL